MKPPEEYTTIACATYAAKHGRVMQHCYACEVATIRQAQREALEEAADAVDTFLRTDKYAYPGNIPSLIRALIPEDS